MQEMHKLLQTCSSGTRLQLALRQDATEAPNSSSSHVSFPPALHSSMPVHQSGSTADASVGHVPSSPVLQSSMPMYQSGNAADATIGQQCIDQPHPMREGPTDPLRTCEALQSAMPTQASALQPCQVMNAPDTNPGCGEERCLEAPQPVPRLVQMYEELQQGHGAMQGGTHSLHVCLTDSRGSAALVSICQTGSSGKPACDGITVPTRQGSPVGLGPQPLADLAVGPDWNGRGNDASGADAAHKFKISGGRDTSRSPEEGPDGHEAGINQGGGRTHGVQGSSQEHVGPGGSEITGSKAVSDSDREASLWDERLSDLPCRPSNREAGSKHACPGAEASPQRVQHPASQAGTPDDGRQLVLHAEELRGYQDPIPLSKSSQQASSFAMDWQHLIGSQPMPAFEYSNMQQQQQQQCQYLDHSSELPFAAGCDQILMQPVHSQQRLQQEDQQAVEPLKVVDHIQTSELACRGRPQGTTNQAACVQISPPSTVAENELAEGGRLPVTPNQAACWQTLSLRMAAPVQTHIFAEESRPPVTANQAPSWQTLPEHGWLSCAEDTYAHPVVGKVSYPLSTQYNDRQKPREPFNPHVQQSRDQQHHSQSPKPLHAMRQQASIPSAAGTRSWTEAAEQICNDENVDPLQPGDSLQFQNPFRGAMAHACRHEQPSPVSFSNAAPAALDPLGQGLSQGASHGLGMLPSGDQDGVQTPVRPGDLDGCLYVHACPHDSKALHDLPDSIATGASSDSQEAVAALDDCHSGYIYLQPSNHSRHAGSPDASSSDACSQGSLSHHGLRGKSRDALPGGTCSAEERCHIENAHQRPVWSCSAPSDADRQCLGNALRGSQDLHALAASDSSSDEEEEDGRLTRTGPPYSIHHTSHAATVSLWSAEMTGQDGDWMRRSVHADGLDGSIPVDVLDVSDEDLAAHEDPGETVQAPSCYHCMSNVQTMSNDCNRCFSSCSWISEALLQSLPFRMIW